MTVAGSVNVNDRNERIVIKRKTILDEMLVFHEAIKVKIIQCNICFEVSLIKLKLVSNKHLVNYKSARCLWDKGCRRKFRGESMMMPCPVSIELQGLCDCEEMYITRAFLVM